MVNNYINWFLLLRTKMTLVGVVKNNMLIKEVTEHIT